LTLLSAKSSTAFDGETEPERSAADRVAPQSLLMIFHVKRRRTPPFSAPRDAETVGGETGWRSKLESNRRDRFHYPPQSSESLFFREKSSPSTVPGRRLGGQGCRSLDGCYVPCSRSESTYCVCKADIGPGAGATSAFDSLRTSPNWVGVEQACLLSHGLAAEPSASLSPPQCIRSRSIGAG
jgi:hypothetical protein